MEGTSVMPKGKIDSDSVSVEDIKERTNSQVALLFDCISSVSCECSKLSKEMYSFASPYSKVGAMEGRSIVVSSKDLKKEKVCERIFELGLKHVEV
ncbi:hypothetical protein QOT17_011051 [Balamuthia mandrillaris]